MNINYCDSHCPIGKAAKNVFLEINNSAFDAAFDFRYFIENCFKTCYCKNEHREDANVK